MVEIDSRDMWDRIKDKRDNKTLMEFLDIIDCETFDEFIDRLYDYNHPGFRVGQTVNVDGVEGRIVNMWPDYIQVNIHPDRH